MRKLKLLMQMSLDGFVSTGPNDEQKWVTWAWKEIEGYILALIDTTDTILIGRKLAVDYIPYWETEVTRTDSLMHGLAQRVVRARKVVFTKTLEKSEWPNTALARGDLSEEIGKLKRQTGKDIIAFGGSSFVAALVEARLIDDFHLFVNPVAIGAGDSIFSRVRGFLGLKLMQSITYESGLVLLHYQPE